MGELEGLVQLETEEVDDRAVVLVDRGHADETERLCQLL
jgi:hypothetical protein